MRITAPLLAAIAKLISGASVRWVDCEPDTCQRVYFANHTSHLDALLLWASLPAEIRYLTRPVAAKDYWERGAIRRYIARQFNALLIDRKEIKVHRSPVQIMLNEIGDINSIAKFVARAKDKTDPFRLMGFGHRVYKNYDPRARIIRKMCHEVLEKLGDANDPTFELALKLEEIALSDEYFIERKLYPNVDFYSGLIYKALGIPTNMFTVMFAIARTVGWVAQWMEMIAEHNQRIGRPRQLYVGPTLRDYVDIDDR